MRGLPPSSLLFVVIVPLAMVAGVAEAWVLRSTHTVSVRGAGWADFFAAVWYGLFLPR